MGTTLGPKYILYGYMEPLRKILRMLGVGTNWPGLLRNAELLRRTEEAHEEVGVALISRGI